MKKNDYKAIDIYLQGPVLKTICKAYGVKKLFSFGSVNSGTITEESDLDLLVDFKENLSLDLFDRYFGLKEKLENLLQRPVDLVLEKKFRNPYFHESVMRSKRLIYED